MDIDKEISDKMKLFEDVNARLQALEQQIGGLKEQQRAIFNKGLELKGQIDFLVELKKREQDALAKSATAKLTLPEGVAPVITDIAPAPQTPVFPAVPLEVK